MNTRTATAALFVSALLPFLAYGDADTTTPSIAAPADQTFAASAIPASPILTPATATDDIDPATIITYAPQTFELGTTTVIWTATDASGNVATTSSQVGIYTPAPAETATIALRDGTTLAGPFTVTLPDASAAAVPLTATGDSAAHDILARSVLALLSSLDASHTEFDITDLQYFSSFGSFFLNCISIPAASSSPECANWTYAVNGSFPEVGMDQTTLANGDAAYVFFGNAWQVSTDKSSVSTGESFTVMAEKYDASSGTYAPAAIEGVGAVQFDSNFTATEFATSTTGTDGKAILSLDASGSYSVGITKTGYFPSAGVTVAAPAAVSSSGSSGGGEVVHFNLNIPSAVSYLVSKQHADGSFGASLYSDWAALAFAASDSGAAKTSLRDHLLASSPSLSSVTDYERHAMALMALGIDPYAGTSKDYITPIVSAFDGTQVGDAALDNDDIFAVFPLLRAGYSPSDPMLQAIAAHIISTQRPDGSWDGSTDMTAAAVQAIGPFFTLPGYGSAMGRAMGYLASSQQADGSWGGVDSTSWVQTMANAAKELDPAHAPSFTSSGGRYPMDALASAQQIDGAVRPSTDSADNRVWSTSYAVVAASGKSWLTLLQPFSRPSSSGARSTGGSVLGVSATSTASTIPTPLTASSTLQTATPSVATSTSDGISTSTPAITATGQSAATATTSALKPKPKIAEVPQPKKVPLRGATSPSSAPAASSHTAAAGAASPTKSGLPDQGFLSGLWHSITSFFLRIF